MKGDANIAALGALLSDPSRCRLLLALTDGRALAASVLAREAGVSASTASEHLGKLLDAGLLQVEPHGRHRYYRLTGPHVGVLLETLAEHAPSAPVRHLAGADRGTVSSPLETERLLLRAWDAHDVALLRGLASDPRVVRYILDGAPWTEVKTAEVSNAMHEHWLAHGFGWRVAVARDSEEPIGFIGLNYAGEGTAGVDPSEFEIGWWIEPERWGRGLASEGARVVCAEAFGRVGAPSVIARLQPGNAASAGVAGRLGMRLKMDTTGRAGEPVRVYRLLREDWVQPGS